MRKSYLPVRFLAVAILLVTGPVAWSQSPSIDGGLTWTGWTNKGLSNQLGLYGSGSTTEVYRVYATSFFFNNNTRTNTGEIGGGPSGGATGFGTGNHSNGAFANGNSILGIGVEAVSGGQIGNWTFARFDLDNDSFKAASSVGGSDGRTSFTQWSEKGDFTTSFAFMPDAWTGQEVSVQVGNGEAYGGPSQAGHNFPAGYVAGGSVGYDFPFRSFRRGISSFQMFFDVTKMQSLYASKGIGTFGNTVGIAMQGFASGTNNVVFSITLPGAPSAVPEPATLSAMFAGMTGLFLLRRRATKA